LCGRRKKRGRKRVLLGGGPGELRPKLRQESKKKKGSPGEEERREKRKEEIRKDRPTWSGCADKGRLPPTWSGKGTRGVGLPARKEDREKSSTEGGGGPLPKEGKGAKSQESRNCQEREKKGEKR